MTPSECSRASGVSLRTVYRDLNDGTLQGEKAANGRWFIDKGEFFCWSEWAWNQSRYLMRSPNWTRGFLQFAEIDKDEQKPKRLKKEK